MGLRDRSTFKVSSFESAFSTHLFQKLFSICKDKRKPSVSTIKLDTCSVVVGS